MASPYRSREGLSSRPVGTSDEVQLRIDPLHGDLDEQISGLHSQVRRLKTDTPNHSNWAASLPLATVLVVAQEIEAETKLQNDLISDLQMTLSQAGTGVKNGMRRLNRTIRQSSNHIVHVIVFGLVFFTFVYLWSKVAGK